MKKLILILSVTLIFSAISCKTTSEIPTDLTASQLIQKGQDAFSNDDYKLAENYYTAVIKRYGTNTEIYIEAKYELGHTYLKSKNYEGAYSAFSEILELYEYSSVGDLPPSFKKLAQIGIKKIPAERLSRLQKSDSATIQPANN
ncbi:MAG: hypothetical protein MJ188_11315 [Treponema sp.]|nr:hypothetical protein [Treponema sp.]